MISEFMREIFYANVTFTGLVIFAAAMVIFVGAVWLILSTNVGKRLGFLITGAGISGWVTINSILFILYAPRGPRQADIEGLNALELRIIPILWLLVSTILFFMFLASLSRYEAEKNKTMR